MSSQTPTIGLKKPEGSDPFLTEDFARNYDLIDAAFAARPAGGGTSVPQHDHSQYLTRTQADGLYAAASHGVHGGGGGGETDLSNYYTRSQVDSIVASHAATTHGGGSTGGTTYTEDPAIVKGPGRTGTKVAFGVFGYAFNNQNGITVTFGFPGVYSVPPACLVTPVVPSNYDLLPNLQGLTAVDASVRLAQKSGSAISIASSNASARVCWMTIGG